MEQPRRPSPAPWGSLRVALSEIDRTLLERCIHRKPRAWEDFVDRFIGLVMHVVNHTARARSISLTPQDREDLVSEVFLEIVKDDLALLRHFRCQSSLATYLTVVSRRIVVRRILQRKQATRLADAGGAGAVAGANGDDVERRLANRDEVERLLDQLEGAEADVVRLHYLEGKSYQEISSAVGMPENSVGPTLSRAREKLRRVNTGQTASS